MEWPKPRRICTSLGTPNSVSSFAALSLRSLGMTESLSPWMRQMGVLLAISFFNESAVAIVPLKATMPPKRVDLRGATCNETMEPWENPTRMHFVAGR